MSNENQSTEGVLREEIARLRSLVVKLYGPASVELGPTFEVIERDFSDVIERALEHG